MILKDSEPNKSEVDINQIFDKFLIYRTKIIVFTLIFSLFTTFFSLQIKSQYKSVALFEIGSYRSLGGQLNAIESSNSLINSLKINQTLHQNLSNSTGVDVIPLQDSFVSLNLTSPSLTENNKSIKKIIDFIFLRHKNIVKDATKYEIDILENQLDNTLSKIDLYKLLIDSIKDNKLLVINSKIAEVENILKVEQNIFESGNKNTELPYTQFYSSQKDLHDDIHSHKMELIDLRSERNELLSEGGAFNLTTAHYRLAIFELTQEKITTQRQINLLKNQDEYQTRILGEVSHSEIDTKKPLIIITGIFISFLLSLFLVFIFDYFKSNKIK